PGHVARRYPSGLADAQRLVTPAATAAAEYASKWSERNISKYGRHATCVGPKRRWWNAV
ncbi:hypothetical protein LTR28_008723, partial [Elasticomyces elasticus]